MRRRGRHRESVSVRQGMQGLDQGCREHPLDGNLVERQHRAKQCEGGLGLDGAGHSVDRVVHLAHVDPAHHRAALPHHLSHPARGRGIALKEPKHCPGIEAVAATARRHQRRRSALRSFSRASTRR